MNTLLYKIDRKINKLDKKNDLDKIIKIYNEGKKIVENCDKKIVEIERMIDIDVSSDEEEMNIKDIIERMENINNELENENIDLDKSLELYNENKKLEKRYKKYKIQNKIKY